jgi:hypothetical protein
VDDASRTKAGSAEPADLPAFIVKDAFSMVWSRHDVIAIRK